MNRNQEEDRIVYRGVKEIVVLKDTDFASAEEFYKWKMLLENEKATISLSNKYIAVMKDLEWLSDAESNGDEDIERAERIMGLAKRVLTERQYRRLYSYVIEGKTLMEIGAIEGISHQNVCKSITAAKKKMKKILSRTTDLRK